MIAKKAKERPIIFTGESPKWILEDRKTQTRRVIKPQPDRRQMGRPGNNYDFEYQTIGNMGWETTSKIKCPYGKPGDHLWVKETWKAWEDESGQDYLHYKSDDKKIIPDWPNESEYWNRLVGKFDKWQSPRFMPRWASRINLEITNIRVERVQDVSPFDIIAEGILIQATSKEFTDWTPEKFLKNDWKNLWNSINKKRGYGWDINPWVWGPIEFKKI